MKSKDLHHGRAQQAFSQRCTVISWSCSLLWPAMAMPGVIW
jgi:hypothetical protein